jgi:hypothetical protein
MTIFRFSTARELARPILLKRFNEFCPSGKSLNSVQPHLQKYFGFAVGQISASTPAILSRRGALAIVTNVGAGCGGRGQRQARKRSQGEMNLVSNQRHAR